MQPVRVMIIEDSVVVRSLLEHIVSEDPRLSLVSSVDSAEAALEALEQAQPHVISMDICLPGMNGLEATRRIMEIRPTPIVVVSGTIDSRETRSSVDALRAGALSVLEKPRGPSDPKFAEIAERLRDQLVIMSRVNVVRQRSIRDVENSFGLATLARQRRPPSVAGLVASTGGPAALEAVLGALPAEYPLPILLVQHIAEGFVDGLVEWLDDRCALTVRRAENGANVLPGYVYVAPEDRHLKLSESRLRVVADAASCGQRPSGTVLLASLAEEAGDGAIGVVLTGMGDDGARGLLAIRRAGGVTIAESEETALVFGMPAAATRMGAVEVSLPLEAIGPRLLSVVECGVAD